MFFNWKLWCFRIKYQELQEAWDQQQCTSTVSVPIPASRHFEDAFIPYRDRHKPPADRGTCPVLYVANGTVGVIHFGLSTADVKLNGRCEPVSALCTHITPLHKLSSHTGLYTAQLPGRKALPPLLSHSQ